MELFSVNRYNEVNETVAGDGENNNLNNLLEKVHKRKKDRNAIKIAEEITEITENIAIEAENVVTPDTPKRKKRKIKDENHTEDSTKEVKSQSPTPDDIGFQVLGEDAAAKQRIQKSEIVLPPWLAHPTIISTQLTNNDLPSVELNIQYPYLATHILQSLKELKLTRLFPVQSEVIPWILQAHTKPPPFRPRDICVSAPTGSGKTLAFAIPVIQLLAAKRLARKVRALVVLPVAELATQVFKVFKKLCEPTDLTVLLFSQNTTFATEQELLVENYKDQYYSKVDIVVTTPGRLVDHLHGTKGFCLKNLEFLVIDEADRIMDAVFQNWFYHLDAHIRNTSDQLLTGRAAPLCLNELQNSSATQPHKLLFSATLSQDPEKLQSLRLFQPKLFTSVISDLKLLREHLTSIAIAAAEAKANNEAQSGEFVGKYTTPAELTEKICITESSLKPLTLYALIQEQGWKKFLCFTNSGDAAHRLTLVLESLLGQNAVMDLTGSMHRNQREKLFAKFTNSQALGLICTDAMARGIDAEVDIVISYDLPRHIKTYIHRIGRTARAGRPGTAVTLLTQAEQKQFNHILSQVGKCVTDEITVTTANEEEKAKDYANALQDLRLKIENEKKQKILAKRHAKLAVKNPMNLEKMSWMQQLQLEIDHAVVERAQIKLGDDTKDDIEGEQSKSQKRKQKQKQKAKLKKQENKQQRKPFIKAKK